MQKAYLKAEDSFARCGKIEVVQHQMFLSVNFYFCDYLILLFYFKLIY